ncbi:MAG: hypothetical protein M1823_003575 [Watsoniomyces obsoletus]|nr:MAG: hypothetical protein M1823_003575 [Watsoniomyces obsoletus]
MNTYEYISSFIIDPVLRQTRRLSPFTRLERPKTLYGAFADLVAWVEHERLAEALMGARLGGAEDAPMDLIVHPEVDANEADVEPDPEMMGRSTEDEEALEGAPTENPMQHVPQMRRLSRGALSRRRRLAHRLEAAGASTRMRSGGSGHSLSSMTLDHQPESGPNTLAGFGFAEPTTPESQPNCSTGEVLPADDGYAELRQRILAIHHHQEASAVEKARLMHGLMNRRYRTLQDRQRPATAHSRSPHDHAGSPTPHGRRSPTCSGHDTPTSHSGPLSLDTLNPHHLTADDLRPTYVPSSPTASSRQGSSLSSHDDDDQAPKVRRLGCPHYKRNVKLQCSTCQRWYTCRFCHDEHEDHPLIRNETKHMLCMWCGCAQPAGEACVNCDERTAWYYCDICKLWDDDSEKSIYHCHDCGICRIGRGLGKDFFHCKTCGVCMSISIASSHKCIERSTDCDCPICGEYMFTSPETVVFMPCGHSIHHKCYYEHMKTSYRCPICSRSFVNMEATFRNLDRAIDSQPMPARFRGTKALVYCNDCCAKSSVSYHWLGLKCALCDSYNTAQIKIFSGPDPLDDDAGHPPEDSGYGNVASGFPLFSGNQESQRRERDRVVVAGGDEGGMNNDDDDDDNGHDDDDDDDEGVWEDEDEDEESEEDEEDVVGGGFVGWVGSSSRITRGHPYGRYGGRTGRIGDGENDDEEEDEEDEEDDAMELIGHR